MREKLSLWLGLVILTLTISACGLFSSSGSGDEAPVSDQIIPTPVNTPMPATPAPVAETGISTAEESRRLTVWVVPEMAPVPELAGGGNAG